MGYGGKYVERAKARDLRAQAWTLVEIANELGVSKASVSVWVRDVDFVPRPRNRGHPAGPKHQMRLKKEAEIALCRDSAGNRIGALSERDRLMYALALYAGEGSTTRSCSRTATRSSFASSLDGSEESLNSTSHAYA